MFNESNEKKLKQHVRAFWQALCQRLLFSPQTKLSFSSNQTSLGPKEWLKSIEELQRAIQLSRVKLEQEFDGKVDIHRLAASTFLFHMERLVVRARECFFAYHFREEQFLSQPQLIQRTEFTEAKTTCLRCYQMIIQLTTTLIQLPCDKLDSVEFVNQIHELELEFSALNSAIRALNRMCVFPEKTSGEVVEPSSALPVVNPVLQILSKVQEGMLSQALDPQNDIVIKEKLKQIQVPEDVELMNQLVNTYDMLKNSYVISRKSVIQESLNEIGKNIDSILNVLLQPQMNVGQLCYYIQQVYSQIESILFSTHREGQYSKYLFDKAKLARHLLRQACAHHSKACQFLSQIELKKK